MIKLIILTILIALLSSQMLADVNIGTLSPLDSNITIYDDKKYDENYIRGNGQVRLDAIIYQPDYKDPYDFDGSFAKWLKQLPNGIAYNLSIYRRIHTIKDSEIKGQYTYDTLGTISQVKIFLSDTTLQYDSVTLIPSIEIFGGGRKVWDVYPVLYHIEGGWSPRQYEHYILTLKLSTLQRLLQSPKSAIQLNGYTIKLDRDDRKQIREVFDATTVMYKRMKKR
ncbi:hypothetical protein LCGC14_1355000 [marine sediment metagenome]|uniref:Uncharacterized protein n=1 Tax=marine sediment metagenome TaxID=412755 RepID=A0A0F9KVY5_9ZZZZ